MATSVVTPSHYNTKYVHERHKSNILCRCYITLHLQAIDQYEKLYSQGIRI
jgi:hypothetical protein